MEEMEPESKSPVLKTGQISKTGQNSASNSKGSSSSIRTRSQTGVIVVHKEALAEVEVESDEAESEEDDDVVRPKRKKLNFMSKKSRVYVKKSRKRKRLKNGNVGIVAYSKRRKVHDDDDDDDYEEEKGKSSTENLEIGNVCAPPTKRYHPRIGAQTNVEAVNMLKEKLNARQIQMFRETCFGHFLDLPPVVVQNQLMHSLLLREEVVEEEEDVLWISVKGVRLRFGLVEFGTITGLKCTGDADKRHDSNGTGHLINTYFSSEITRVAKQSLIECFHNQRWKSDEDAVKLAVLYFIHTFLFSTLKCKHISRDEFELVESGAYETYPWGKAVFKDTLKSMKGKLKGMPAMYRLGGLPLAFQCWFYECCPYVNNKIAFRVDDKVPRILSWKVTRQPTFKELFNVIFRQRQDQLKLRNISPTEFEKTTLGLPESFEIEEVNKVASEDIAEVDVIYEDISNPPQASRKLRKTKHNPVLNNDDWSTELKRLSDGQSELKSEIQMLNNELVSLNDCMRVSFAKVFKAIESLSKKQGEKTASELDGGNDPHDRHGDSNSSEFSEDNGSEGQGHGKDSIGDKDNNEKANEGTIGNVEGGETVGDPVKEVERMDASDTQILPDTCEVSDHIIPEQLTKPSDKEIERMDVSETQILPDTCEVSDHIIPEQLTNPSDKEVETMDVSETQILPDTCEVSDHIIPEQLTNPSDKEVETMDVSETQILPDTCEVSDYIIPEQLTNPSDKEVETMDASETQILPDTCEVSDPSNKEVETMDVSETQILETMDVCETQILPDTCEVSDHIISEQSTKPSNKEVETMDASETQILQDTCEVSDHIIPEQLTKPSDPAPVLESQHVNQGDTGVEGSSKTSSNVIDNVDYSLLTEFDKWVDEGVKKQSK